MSLSKQSKVAQSTVKANKSYKDDFDRPPTAMQFRIDFGPRNGKESTQINSKIGAEAVKGAEPQKPIHVELYDVQSNLSLEIRSQLSVVRLPSVHPITLPITISLKAKDLTLEQLEMRPSIDLICVLDVSGSMSGRKLQLVKDTIVGLQRNLRKDDRLCLIKFNQTSKRTELSESTPEFWEHLRGKLDNLKAQGGTSIHSGLGLAFKTLQERKTAKDITGIFLLTDGRDDSPINGMTQIEKSLSEVQNVKFSISAFGFGDDHDPIMLQRISRLRDGEFYYVDRLEVIAEHFAASLGGMVSTVAQQIDITVEEIAKGPLESTAITKTYGELWKSANSKKRTVKIPKLMAGSERSFVLQLTLPPMDFRLESRSNLPVLKVRARGISSIDKSNFSLKNTLRFTLDSGGLDFELPANDMDVMRHYLRVRTAETIEEALYMANRGEYESAEQKLKEMHSEIKAMPDEPGFRGLLERLDECVKHCQPRRFGQTGEKVMMRHAQQFQREQPCVDQRYHCHLTNIAITRMVDEVRQANR